MDNKQKLFEMMGKLNSDFHQQKPKFIIPIGISGSGKSTWIKSLVNDGYSVISPDEIRRELTGNISDQTKNREVFQIAFQRAIELLNNGNSVIFDATNISSKTRSDMLANFKKNITRDFDALAKVFTVDPEISKERIRKDIESGVDRSNVPPEAIDRQYRSFVTDLDKIESDGYTIIN